MKSLLLILLTVHSLLGFTRFLTAEEAFRPTAKVSGGKLTVTVRLADDIMLYKKSLKVVSRSRGYELTNVTLPDGTLHDGKEIFRGEAVITADIVKTGPEAGDRLKVEVSYQGCSDKGLCYEPQVRTLTPAVDPSGVGVPETDGGTDKAETDGGGIAETLHGGNIGLILLTFFGFGLLLALTPCVFPMIPILSSIIVAQGEGMTARKGFVLSLVYVLSMSVAYTFAGVLAGLFGSNIQASMQNPWVLSAFAAVFVVLALSMFGFFEIGLPASVQSRLSKTSDDAGRKGGLAGVAVMGFLSALIVGPCVAPPLAGALVYIGQTGDAVLGGAALFVMSLGMGMPLLLIGTGAGRFMPRPGGWMNTVSKVFGVVMLAIAVWMLSRILPGSVVMLLWSLLLIVSSVYLGAFEPLGGTRSWNALLKGAGIVLFLFGAAMLLGFVSGASNTLDPLEKFTRAGTVRPGPDLPRFEKTASLSRLREILRQTSGKKVLVDFYADWCTSCKELEHNTFSDPAVRRELAGYTLLQVDLTDNTAEDKKMLKAFSLFGPPAILVFENGKRIRTIIGYQPPETFLDSLRRAAPTRQ